MIEKNTDIDNLANLPSPLIRVEDPLWTDQDIGLWIKRDDLIHPYISGNKYRKLSFLLPEYTRGGYRGILSFGGPHSNHIHALAWMCHLYDIPLTVLIRSHDEIPHSPMIEDALSWGASVRCIPPEIYRWKDNPEQILHWKNEFPDYLILPEGGSHEKAPDGFQEMIHEIDTELPGADYYICPEGTGATLAGIVRFKKPSQWCIGVSALKSSTLHLQVSGKWNLSEYHRWTVADQWHFGGYGQISMELVKFIERFYEKHDILLDPLYNGKAMYAFFEYLKFKLIPPGSQVVFVHTGGLQGWRGFRTGLYGCEDMKA